MAQTHRGFTVEVTTTLAVTPDRESMRKPGPARDIQSDFIPRWPTEFSCTHRLGLQRHNTSAQLPKIAPAVRFSWSHAALCADSVRCLALSPENAGRSWAAGGRPDIRL